MKIQFIYRYMTKFFFNVLKECFCVSCPLKNRMHNAQQMVQTASQGQNQHAARV